MQALPCLQGKVSSSAERFVAVAYEIPEGCAASYFPEANVLVPLAVRADRSETPASKLVVVDVRPARDLQR